MGEAAFQTINPGGETARRGCDWAVVPSGSQERHRVGPSAEVNPSCQHTVYAGESRSISGVEGICGDNRENCGDKVPKRNGDRPIVLATPACSGDACAVPRMEELLISSK